MFALKKGRLRVVTRRCFLVPMVMWGGAFSPSAQSERAAWFPDAPTIHRYVWDDAACATCQVMTPEPEWRHMAALAGVPEVRFMTTPDERRGPAYAIAPDVVVLSPSARTLPVCQLAFVVGHELVHVARRHFDEDVVALLAFSRLPDHWSERGEDAMQLLEHDYGLVLRLSEMWQRQEQEADWLGALLSAEARGCTVESGALAYLRGSRAGGGIGAAHAPSAARMHKLLPFAESARRLADLAPR